MQAIREDIIDGMSLMGNALLSPDGPRAVISPR